MKGYEKYFKDGISSSCEPPKIIEDGPATRASSLKKSSLTLDFSQVKRSNPSLRKSKFHGGNEDDGSRCSSGKDGHSIPVSTVTSRPPGASVEDNLPVVLASPDVDMVKLSTPDLDNYLFQLQQELSFTTPASGSCPKDVPRSESSKSSVFDYTAPSASQTESEINFPEDFVVHEEINAPSSREIINDAGKVSAEGRFNSFDSGFSDVSVKTEMESEMEEDIKTKLLNWQIFDPSKTGILFPTGNEDEPTNDICSEGYERGDTQCPHSLQSEIQAFVSRLNCSDGHIGSQAEYDSRLRRPANFMSTTGYNNDNIYHYPPPLPASDSVINQSGFDLQRNNKQENKKSRQETLFNSSSVDSSNTKQIFKEEPSHWMEFSCSSLDSNSGGLCSDYSSFDDGSAVPRHLQSRVASQKAVEFSNRRSCEHPIHLSLDQGSNHSTFRADYDLARHTMTLEAKRRSFRRQKAESMPDHAADDGLNDNQLREQFDEFLIDKSTLTKAPNQIIGANLNSIKTEPLTKARSPTSYLMGNSMPFDPTEQEYIKLQRKRARNRLAATRCRNRKLERINFLRAEVEYLRGLNSNYADRVSRLRGEVDQLKCQVMNHVTRGCDLSCLWV